LSDLIGGQINGYYMRTVGRSNNNAVINKEVKENIDKTPSVVKTLSKHQKHILHTKHLKHLKNV
jgi:hypothetical protein